MISRRSFIKDILLLSIAPAIIRVGSIMPVKAIVDISYVSWNPTSFNPLTKHNILDFILETEKMLKSQGFFLPHYMKIPDHLLGAFGIK